jgi:hypothetical protein
MMRTQFLVLEDEKEPLQQLVKGTRVEHALMLSPLLREAFSDFIVNREHPGTDKDPLNSTSVSDVIHMLYVCKNDFGDKLWTATDVEFPNQWDDSIEMNWLAAKHLPPSCMIHGKHVWTYLSAAWKDLTGARLPGRRKRGLFSMKPRQYTPQAFYFAFGVAGCFWLFRSKSPKR